MDSKIIDAAKKAQTINKEMLVMLASMISKLDKISYDSEEMILVLCVKEQLLLLEILNEEIEDTKDRVKRNAETIKQAIEINSKNKFLIYLKKLIGKKRRTTQIIDKNLEGFFEDLNELIWWLDVQSKFLKCSRKLVNGTNNCVIKTRIIGKEKCELKCLIASKLQYQLYGYNSGPLPELTKYYAIDNWKEIKIEKQRIYAITTEKEDYSDCDRAIEGNFKGKFFFDQSTFDHFYDEDNKNFDAKKLSRCLQVAPYKKCQGDNGTYRNSILCFDLEGEITVAGAICEANTAYGGGGAHQVYIDNIEKLQHEGILTLNREESMKFKGKGIHASVSQDEWNNIDDAFVLRILKIAENGYRPLTYRDKEATWGIEDKKEISGDFFGIPNDKSNI